MTLTMLRFLYPVVLIALAVILVRGYIRTRNIGYLVLMVPLPLWSLIPWGALRLVKDEVGAISSGSTAPFLTRGEIWAVFLQGTRVIQALLILVGFLLLNRSSALPFKSTRSGAAPLES